MTSDFQSYLKYHITHFNTQARDAKLIFYMLNMYNEEQKANTVLILFMLSLVFFTCINIIYHRKFK